MPLTSQQFAKELEAMVSKRRAFWDHPWIQKFRRAELSEEQIRHWIEQQFAVEVVSKLTQTDEEQKRVREAVDHTLELLWRFFDGPEFAYGQQRKAA